MSVPETSVDENRGAVASHHNIRLPRHAFDVESVAIPMPPQPASHLQFRLSVAGTDMRHAEVALGWGEAVGHNV